MTTGSSSNAGPLHKLVEAGITLLIALFGVIVIIGSVKAGINWGAEGPRAGFFPFYIGIFIVVSSGINLWNGLRDDNDDLFGAAVQLAARLCGFASAGEIVASVAVRELSVGKQFRFEDRGLVQLKGLPEPTTAYRVAWRDDDS